MVFNKFFMAKVQFIPGTSNDSLLIPPNVGDFIPEDSPVRLVNSVLDMVDISDIVRSYRNITDGRPAYNPRMLLKIVVYGYFNNIFSSRDLESVLRRDAHMIWLSGYQFPDHTTINRFRVRFEPFIKKTFSSLGRILAERGEIAFDEELYVDGTTIRSRAARRSIKWRHAAENFSAMAEESIQKSIDRMLEQIDESVRNELVEEGQVSYTAEEARELAEEVEKRMKEEDRKKVRSSIKAVREACDRKEKHDKTLEQCHGRCGIAPSDPECGIMHAKEDGYQAKPTPNYNVQAATQNQYVLNYGVYDTSADKKTAIDFFNTCIAENGEMPQAIVADGGYGCEELYVTLERMGIEAVIKYNNFDRDILRSLVNNGDFDKRNFRLTASQDNLICPAGHEMIIVGVEKSHTESGFPVDRTKFTCTHCKDCPFKDKCYVTTNKDNITTHNIRGLIEEDKARKRLMLPENQARLRRRNLEPEAVFGQMKHNRGYKQFRHFGKAKVTTDLGFMFMALNLRKLYRNTEKMSKKG